MRTLLVAFIALALLISGLLHLLSGQTVDRLMAQPRNVRLVGVGLLVVAVPCLLWHGRYFTILGALLGLSGALRLFAPALNTRLQTRSYPRWVHGLLLLTGALLTWVLSE